MEANVHTRISWGLALLSLITTVDYLDAQFQETPAEPMRHAGPFGGFCPSHERPRELMRAIQRWQDAILPEDLQWPKENKQEATTGLEVTVGTTGLTETLRKTG